MIAYSSISQQLYYILRLYGKDRPPRWGAYHLLEYYLWTQIYLTMCVITVFSISILLSARDEALRKLEKSSRQHTQEMEKFIAIIRTAQEQAELASEQKSKFIALMAHEIRNPIHVITNLMGDLIGLYEDFLQRVSPHPISTARELDNHQSGRRTDGKPLSVEYLQTMLEDALNSHIAIESSTRFLLSIVNDMLDIGRLESGKLELEVQPVRLREHLQDSLFVVLSESAKSKSVVFESSILDAVPPVVLVDIFALEHVLHNLASNAIKFTKAGGRISVHISTNETSDIKSSSSRVSSLMCGVSELHPGDKPSHYVDIIEEHHPQPCSSESGIPLRNMPISSEYIPSINKQKRSMYPEVSLVELAIVVADTGIGIPSSSLPALFTPYTQVSVSTAREFGGSGLGLSISSMLVQAMGGRIHVESEVDKGTIFTVTLPVRVPYLTEEIEGNLVGRFQRTDVDGNRRLQASMDTVRSPDFAEQLRTAAVQIAGSSATAAVQPGRNPQSDNQLKVECAVREGGRKTSHGVELRRPDAQQAGCRAESDQSPFSILVVEGN
ncbi:hypothetical protein HK102_011894 [Quaeritorhiza haematococci]|nr:hypothetical protein HK102_011894 [Quaeritorhiza haematococci]